MPPTDHYTPPAMPAHEQAVPLLWERTHRVMHDHEGTAETVAQHATVLAEFRGVARAARIAGGVLAFLIMALIALAGLTVKRLGDVHDQISTISPH